MVGGCFETTDHKQSIFCIYNIYNFYCFVGGANNKPFEYLHVLGQTTEEQIVSLVKNVFEPAGFGVETFTRLPYLCEGDLEHSLYLLNDIVFVLKPA